MIIVRCIFRAIELSDGFSGELANNEVVYMILEPPMISLAVIALTVCHPGVSFQGTWLAASTKIPEKRSEEEKEPLDPETSYSSTGEGIVLGSISNV
jgi:hypothetical protein